MAAKNIGFISELVGNAEIRTEEGMVKVALLGDIVKEGDLVSTGQNSYVVIDFNNGEKLSIGAQAQVTLDDSVTFDSGQFDASLVDQQAALQQLILEGLDVSVLEETAAARESQGLDSSSLKESNVYERDGIEGQVDTRLTPIENEAFINPQTTFGSESGINQVNTTTADAVQPVVSGNFTIALNVNITSDGVINSSESNGIIAITGSVGSDVNQGDIVTLVINGEIYTGLVQADKSFSIDVAGSDLLNDPDSTIQATISSTDTSGNTFTASDSQAYLIDVESPIASITLDAALTSDNIINAEEAAGTVPVAGTVSGEFQAGDLVTLTVNGVSYSGPVEADGSFSIDVQGSDLIADPDSNIDVSFIATDLAGNTSAPITTSIPFSTDTSATASIVVDSITADDIINSAEANSTIAVTGSVGGDASQGDSVTLTINNTVYSGLVEADGIFSIDVAGSDLAVDTTFEAKVTGTDEAGNTFDTSTISAHTVVLAPVASISLDTNLTPDDIINAAESEGLIAVTGSVSGNFQAGDIVSITVNGVVSTTAVAADGSFSVDVQGSDLLADIDQTIEASFVATDTAGNIAEPVTDTDTYSIDTTANATITLDPNITADDIVNAAEASNLVPITGSVTGDFQAGDLVTITVNNVPTTGSVDANGLFSIDVQGSDLLADSNSSVEASFVATDASGNTASPISTTESYSVNLTGTATITVDNITVDDVMNADESGTLIAVTGSVGGDASEGDTVSFTVNGNPYNGLVAADGTFSIDVAGTDLAADSSFNATVTGTNDTGSHFSVSTRSTHIIDTTADAGTVTISTIAGDDIINPTESIAATIVVAGIATGGDIALGDTVTVKVNGTDYTTTVGAGGAYSVDVATADLIADNSIDVVVKSTDDAGNTITSSAYTEISLDLNAAVSLSATAEITEAGGTVTYTAIVDNAPATDMTINLSNGENITITAGNTSGTVDVTVAADEDAITDASSLSATISSTLGGGLEAVSIDATPAVTTITDTIDTTTVSLSATGSITEAGGSVTYTASVDNAVASDMTVTLDNGETITITAGNTSGTVDVAVAADEDAIAETSSLSAKISSTSGGGLEAVSIDATPAVTNITDTIDTTTVSLSATGSITEASGTVTYTASVDNAPATDMTVTLDNGETITVTAGNTSGTVDVAVAADEDAIVDASQISAIITSTSGGGLEAVSIDATPVVTNITDTIDTTTVSLSATDSVVEGGTITYTATLDNPSDTAMTVTLSNGQSIAIAAGASSGTVDVIASDDVHVGGDSASATITSTSGGNFENLVVDSTAATTTITDDADVTNLALSATGSVVEGGTITYTATLDNPSDTAMTVTLSNGQSIAIAAGASSGTVDVTASDDVHVGGDSASATITSTSGGNFENLIVDSSAATTTISDDADITNLSLSSTSSVVEGGTITYTATLDNPSDTAMTVTLSNGQSIAIAAGASSGTVDVIASDDVHVGGDSASATITGTSGGNFENLVVDSTAAVTTITDSIDTTTVSLSATASITEAGGIVTYTASVDNATDTDMTVTLDNGEVITITAGNTAGTVDVTVIADEDAIVDASTISAAISSTSGGNFENVSIDNTPATTAITDTIDTTTVSLSATGSITDNGGNITYTAAVDNAPATDLTVNLDNGEVITISAGALTGTVIVNFDSTELIGIKEVSAIVSGTTGGEFENVSIDTTPAATSVIDTTAPTISFNAIATDNVVDNSEDNAVVISGSTTGVEDGQTITVNVAGINYTTTVSGNSWALPAIDMSGFTEGTRYNVTADISDVAGNAAIQAATSFDNVASSTDDVAVVHESALSSGSGQVESLFDADNELSQNPGEGLNVATGNLLSNDSGANGIQTINGNGPDGSGMITVSGTYGELVVDANTGNYSYTLTSAADNSAVVNDDSILESFTYTNNLLFTSSLNITILDDGPSAQSNITEVAQNEMLSYNLMLMLDISTSMTNASNDGVVYMPDGSSATRLEIAKQSLIALGQEYFQQSTDVEIKVGVFAGGSYILNGGTAYTDYVSFQTAVNAITDAAGDPNLSDGTNYESALNSMEANFDVDATGANISYFLSDGEISRGSTDLANDTNWVNFAATNNIESFATGTGTGLTDFSDLNYIHNIDSNGDGTTDNALVVPDLTKLDSVLLATVPQSYGGSIASGGVSGAVFGADGGFVQSITILLDADANTSTPDQAVTFTFDPIANSGTGEITNDAGLTITAGTVLTLSTGTGFTQGSLIFDFSEGEYNYFVGVGVNEGDTFNFDYTLADNDGDVSSTETLTIVIVDGVPQANDDLHTINLNDTSATGNVISGIGTDGGVSLSSSFTSFSAQGEGVDIAVDNAVVTSIDYRGDTLDLTTDELIAITAIASDGSSYTYTVSGGELNLTNVTDGSALEFHTSGFYEYTPASGPVAQTGATVVEDFTDGASGNGVNLTAMLNTTLTFDGNNGVGISGGTGQYNDSVDGGELLEIVFDTANYAYGVQNVLFDFGWDNRSGTLRIFHIDGTEMGTEALTGADTQRLPLEYSNIGKITLQAGSAGDYSIQNISFDPIILDSSSTAAEQELIGYTLTDEDGSSSEATLTINTVQNSITGTVGNDTLSGTDLNDRIVGQAGNDIISGGEGNDILEGGVGNDTLYGNAGNDLLSGGIGMDVLRGGAGNDTLKGGDDNDQLYGGAGDDTLSGGKGSNTLFGGAGDDSLMGGAGIDFLYGGQGNDTLEGGAGSDTFIWQSGDNGTVLNPTLDTISDFSAGAGGDKLDLSNLLQGEESGSLTDFLHFDSDGNGGTMVSVDVDGGGSFETSQQINLVNVDLTVGGSLSDQDIINNLLANENINFD